MWQNIIGEYIRRANRNLVIVNVLVLLAVAGVVSVSWRYLENCLKGPFSISREKLFSTSNPEDLKQYYVTVPADDIIDPDLTETETHSYWVTTSAHYFLLRLDDHFLVVKSPYAKMEPQYTGALVPFPHDNAEKFEENINAAKNDIVAHYRQKSPNMQVQFLPYMMDATSFRTEAYWLVGFCAIAAFFGISNLVKASKRMGDLNQHPAVAGLLRYGNAQDVSYQIDTEFRMGPKKIGPAQFTDSWLVKPSFFGVDVVKLDSVVWAYEKVTQHRTNGIPTGKTYSALIYDRHKQMVEVQGKKDQVEQILANVASKAPWIISGFTKELEKQWKASPEAVIAAVDQRKQQGPT